MSVRPLQLFERVRASYWFVPAMMSAAAALLAAAALELDARYPGALPFRGLDEPEAARTFLSTVAGSIITVAGVVFSITILVVGAASSQFGPRMIWVFMHDLRTQVSLGVFSATFVYCLLILRAIRDGAPVPHASVSGALLMALASFGTLIFFIHHQASAIQAPHVIAAIRRSIAGALDERYPSDVGEPGEGVEGFGEEGRPVLADAGGYLQAVDGRKLLDLARANDLEICIEFRPGRLVVARDTLLRAAPAERVGDDVAGALRACFGLGRRPTPAQDLEFELRQLVEIAVRALSPGVNDPFTAVNALDCICDVLCEVASRDVPSPWRRDAHGRVRLYAPVPDFRGLVDVSFDQIRQHARGDVAVSVRILEVLETIAHRARDDAQREALQRQATMVLRASRDLPEEEDRADVENRHARVLATLRR